MGFYEIAQRAERTQRIGLMSDARVSRSNYSIINRKTFWFAAAVGAHINHIYKYAPFGLQANCQF